MIPNIGTFKNNPLPKVSSQKIAMITKVSEHLEKRMIRNINRPKTFDDK